MTGNGDAGMMSFTINGKSFDGGRTDTPVETGTVEEWTLKNPSPMGHPLHLRVRPMQVIEDGRGSISEARWRDIVNVPVSGSVKAIIAFDDFSGRTTYHSHILDHENQGMMVIVAAS